MHSRQVIHPLNIEETVPSTSNNFSNNPITEKGVLTGELGKMSYLSMHGEIRPKTQPLTLSRHALPFGSEFIMSLSVTQMLSSGQHAPCIIAGKLCIKTSQNSVAPMQLSKTGTRAEKIWTTRCATYASSMKNRI